MLAKLELAKHYLKGKTYEEFLKAYLLLEEAKPEVEKQFAVHPMQAVIDKCKLDSQSEDLEKSAKAHFILGRFFETGKFLKQNMLQAMQHYLDSAKNGSVSAYLEMVRLADQGNPFAQVALGFYFSKGMHHEVRFRYSI